MSTNKRKGIELTNYSQMKDSFDVRVCDDLSEELLQYLTIEDKLRLECVSKQFQRTVFTKHKRIVIDRRWYKRGNSSKRQPTVDCQRLKTALKKAQNISEIVINFHHLGTESMTE